MEISFPRPVETFLPVKPNGLGHSSVPQVEWLTSTR
jgi:hypothetical protein